MMVLMALATTFMTGPLLNLASGRRGIFSRIEPVRDAP
jgi:hypothetical protein